MGHAIWKLTSLVGISGLGFLILLQAQQGLQDSKESADTKSVANKADEPDSHAPGPDPQSQVEDPPGREQSTETAAHDHDHHDHAPKKAITWHSNPFGGSEKTTPPNDEMTPVAQREPAEKEVHSAVHLESDPSSLKPSPTEMASSPSIPPAAADLQPANFEEEEEEDEIASEPAPFRREPDTMLMADASEAIEPPPTTDSADTSPAFLDENEDPAPAAKNDFGPNPFAIPGAPPEPEHSTPAEVKPELAPGPAPAPAGAVDPPENDEPVAASPTPEAMPAEPPFGGSSTIPETEPGDAVPFDPSSEKPSPNSSPPLQPEPMPEEETKPTPDPVTPDPMEEKPAATPAVTPVPGDPFGTTPSETEPTEESLEPIMPDTSEPAMEAQPQPEIPAANPFGDVMGQPSDATPADEPASPPVAAPAVDSSKDAIKTDKPASPVVPDDDPFAINEDPFGTEPMSDAATESEMEAIPPAEEEPPAAPPVEPNMGEIPPDPAVDPLDSPSPFGGAPPIEARPEPLTSDGEMEPDLADVPAEPDLATPDTNSSGPFPAVDSNEDAKATESDEAPADEAPAVVNGMGTVTPDDPSGPQHAKITVEKKAPPQAALGEPLTYEIVVTNVGESPAHEVIVSDAVPKGTTLQGTIPQAIMKDDRLTWKLGTLKPKESSTIRIRVIPTEPGSIGSVATVNFVSEVAARTEIVTPKLVLRLSAPQEVALGQAVDFRFEIANEGSAPAQNVILRDVLPEGFRHADGNDLEYEVGTLPPGAVKTVTLRVATIKAGEYSNHAVLTGKGGLKSEATASVTITGQPVSLIRKGPKQRFVGRPAVYTNIVRNPSDKPVASATVIETIPAGMEFVQATGGGKFHPDERTISWQIGPLAPGEETQVEATLTAATEGVHKSVVWIEQVGGSPVRITSTTKVDSMTNLTSAIQNLDQPVIVGERAAFRILLQNQGDAPASDVLVSLALPEQVKFIQASGGDAVPGTPGVMTIQSAKPIPPGGEQAIEFVIEGIAIGDARLRASIHSAQLTNSLIREADLQVIAARS